MGQGEGAIVTTAPTLPLVLTYDQAGEQLGISGRKVRTLVERGVLVRPAWSYTEVRAAVVTTASVAAAAGWPVLPLEVAVAPEGQDS